MRKLLIATMGCLAAAFLMVQPADAGQSLRGDLDIEAQQKAPEMQKLHVPDQMFKRTFKEQPPLVPHKNDKYKITMKSNKCIKCHDKKYYKEEEAPMIGKSHYLDKDGKEQKTLNMGRYFCNQCHVTQVIAKPLVNNTFTGNN